MTLFSFLFAMLLEQVRPVRAEGKLGAWIPRLLTRVERMTSTGERNAAIWTWVAVVVGGALLSWVLVGLLTRLNVLLGFLATVGVLYLTMGFRQFSNRFTEIQLALAENDLPRARQELAQWAAFSGGDAMTDIAAKNGDVSDISREAIRLALVAAQRHVFGVIFWFVILPGPMGAVLYRLSAEARRVWSDAQSAGPDAHQAPSAFGEIALKTFAWIDWFPARVTAIVFAIVGNFEDAILMWRAKSGFAPHANDTERVLLSAGAGAMGIRLSVPDALSASIQPEEPAETEALGGAWPSPSQDMPQLKEADESSLRSAVGLVWRAVILWFAMVFLVSIGYWLG
jgi:adenosylcobinamide-phosphate synthase